MTNQLSIAFVDEDGKKGTHRYPVIEALANPDGPAAQALVTALDGVSNAAIVKTSVLVDEFPATVVKGTGPYDAQDKMVTAFTTLGGTALRMAIPAPIRALMETNDETWAAGQAAVDSLVAAAIAVVTTAGGSAVNGLKKSWRSRRNRAQ